jgi:DNA-binding CsgD family transcriptional regulator
MSSQSKRFLLAVDDIYAAGLGERSWCDALSRISDICGGSSAIVFDADRTDGSITGWEEFNLQGGGPDEYIAHINAINPRMHYSLRQRSPHVAWDYLIANERAIRRHEFYDWLRKQKLKYFVGGRIRDVGSRSTFASVDFTARQGHPDRGRIQLFSRLVPHIRNARAISELRSNLPFAGECEGLLLDRTSTAIFMLGAEGRVAFMNQTADELVTRADVVSVRDGRLTFESADSEVRFEQNLDALIKAQGRGEIHGDVTMQIEGRTGAGLVLRLLPSPRPVRSAHGISVAAHVLIDAPPRASATLMVQLQAIYGLTRREAELTQRLWEYGALPPAAEAMQISVNTGRNHLQRAFAKMGTRSQNELMKRMGQLLNWR